MIEKDKRMDPKEKIDEYSEIKEALAAMERAAAIEDKEATNLFELMPSYFPIRF